MDLATARPDIYCIRERDTRLRRWHLKEIENDRKVLFSKGMYEAHGIQVERSRI